MSRVLMVVACMAGLATTSVAHADPISDNTKQLANKSSAYRIRMASTLALAKSKDARAIIALADALAHDSDATIRRIAALALETMIDASTPNDARELALTALAAAAKSDTDTKVRDTASKTLKVLTPFRRGSKPAPATGPRGNRPEVFVQIETISDQSKKLTTDASDRMAKIVKKGVERTGYATAWPGGPPSKADLASAKSRAFIVASTVKKIEIKKAGQTDIACMIEIRMSPWGGKDGGERWEANKAANASGSAKTTTSNSDREVNRGIRDCLEAVAEDVTQRQVVPFLKRLALSGS